MIDVQSLGVRFGSRRGHVDAVRGVSFQVETGEAFGLVGESGSGKTTVLRALCGLAPVSAGHATVGGHVLGGALPRAFRRDVQMVFQDPYGSLHPRFTVDRTLREPLAIAGSDRHDARIVDALHEVGLGPAFRFRYPHQLSGGQRQRVAIARALIVEPRVLLLDEPTSALDVSVQAEILNLLRRLHRERSLTIVLVSHNLAVVGFLCSRVAVMRNGEIVEQAGIDAVRARRVEHEYTRRMLEATDGYRRETAPG
ncbi:ABC transporter ATP-binding protein [Paraburkholderia caballeronis]|uniref:ABC transporter ATP-binding protein n=1 Tax=Paraburkholderia caballeronis TaxID=416943 RepID=UPI0010662692|nr:ABC transporter ATP-binding protein [Paraburkholderia caballeronis]TDV07193.1 peptide/nickel transport system ATP-binding protein [Paraburkholderia caballeronis]TDV11337.1 peptide/nickel transport system ATP-binding protein [Paraburkholderia caballeronis]TDV22522.1 peptide/nickel transport system ATP-binding protein [Paraburkholderia caballeronis]